MSLRRVISIVLLGALLAVQTTPARAGQMLCKMKAPARTEACSRCDAPRASEANGSIRAADCCRVSPRSDSETTPIVPAARAASSHDLLPSMMQPASLTFMALDADHRAAWTPSAGPPGSERLSRTTILRN
ncbi:MAG TPA: hypothetical protein VFX78_11185 [Candidatus Eisenbacteria bacterium]|nr:hypothetical protein [Candidatus Eisenbacteria bacterium]